MTEEVRAEELGDANDASGRALMRRELIGRTGMALGGALVLGAWRSSSADDAVNAGAPYSAAPQVKDFPYERNLPPSYQLASRRRRCRRDGTHQRLQCCEHRKLASRPRLPPLPRFPLALVRGQQRQREGWRQKSPLRARGSPQTSLAG